MKFCEAKFFVKTHFDPFFLPSESDRGWWYNRNPGLPPGVKKFFFGKISFTKLHFLGLKNPFLKKNQYFSNVKIDVEGGTGYPLLGNRQMFFFLKKLSKKIRDSNA